MKMVLFFSLDQQTLNFSLILRCQYYSFICNNKEDFEINSKRCFTIVARNEEE